MNKEKIAFNLLSEKLCDSCEYYRGNYLIGEFCNRLEEYFIPDIRTCEYYESNK